MADDKKDSKDKPQEKPQPNTEGAFKTVTGGGNRRPREESKDRDRKKRD